MYRIEIDTLKAYNGLQSNEISVGQKLNLNPVNN
jgi:LysM repeat protein